jgi:Ca-activated chloride channel family protein
MVSLTKERLTSAHWRKLACTLVACGIPLQVPSMGQNPPPPLPEKPPVQVFITATGKHGPPVMLSSSDLSVSVDKQAVRVDEVRSAKNDPLLFAVLVDISKSDSGDSDDIRKAALQLFQSLSVGGNQGYLVFFNEVTTMSTAPIATSRVQQALKIVSFNGGTAVYEAIVKTCSEKLSKEKNLSTPRRAIILLSDGEDNASRVPATKAETEAERQGIAVFSLATSNSGLRTRGEQFLKEISRTTGARAIVGKSLEKGVPDVVSAIEDQWALRFLPIQTDQKLHSLQIKSGQKDVDISAPAHFLE